MKIKNYTLPLLLAFCIAIGMWIGNIFSSRSPFGENNVASNYGKMRDIMEVLDKKYVDTLNVNALFEQSISDMLHKLDPHSNYIPAKDLKALNENIQGEFGGVGIRFIIIRDTICITNVVNGSPSYKAGIKAGDKILLVDNKMAFGKKITNEKVMSMLKGPANTKVKVKVLHFDGKTNTYELNRDMIPIASVSVAYMIEPQIGFIRIDEFSVTTAEEFKFEAAKLKMQGMKKLILDLRFNGGGVLQTAAQIADEFLADQLEIVQTKGQHMKPYTYKASSIGNLEDIKLAILINGQSASASEILAGAIQDNDRGLIIGRRSFGKGLVQEDIELKDGSNLRLTIARYYTPSGRCIQKEYKNGYEAYMKDQMRDADQEGLFAPDSSYFKSQEKFKTKNGRTVYGGGGIMPDVFVPFDSSGNSWYFTELRYQQAFQIFAFDFIKDKRQKWSSLDKFDETFVVSDALLNTFVEFANNRLKIRKNPSDFKQSKALIARTLKGEIARQIWLETGFFKVGNKQDKELQMALKKLR